MAVSVNFKRTMGEYRSGRMVIDDETACYHIVNRTNRREFWFGDQEKAVFRKIMFKQAAFSGVEVLSFCIMSNHFHILVRIPHILDEAINDQELLRRFESLYGDYAPPSVPAPADLRILLNENGDKAVEWRNRLKNRMGKLDWFMRELKQRFIIWYNGRHSNEGTIFSQTYRSTLIEDHWHPLSVVSAYIDLNPVRAKLVTDPVDYFHCSYSAIMNGDPAMEAGLTGIYGSEFPSVEEVLAKYRMLLYRQSSSSRTTIHSDKKCGRIPSATAENIINSKGRLSLPEILHKRVRYFTSGAILGRKNFMNKIFEGSETTFSAFRKSRGSPMLYGEWGGLHSWRKLQKEVIQEE